MDNIKEVLKTGWSTGKILREKKGDILTSLNTARRILREKQDEKAKTYGFIGMEVYDLSKEGKIDVPQIKGYFDKMDEINQEIDKQEKQIQELEDEYRETFLKKNGVGINVCTCGSQLKPQDRFCPNCGKVVQRDIVVCSCGTELNKNVKFCHSCGKSMEVIIKEQEEPKQLPMKECICGAKVPTGQFMCLECGRKIE